MDSLKGFTKKNWFGLVSAAISGAVLAFFLVRAGGARVLAESAAGIHKLWMAAAIGCTMLFWLLDTVILHRYIRLKYKRHRFRHSFRTTMVGFLYNCLTPFASGGQPMQVYDMTLSGIDTGDAVSYVTAKAMVYQVSLTLYTIVALFFSLGFFMARIPSFTFFLLLGALANAAFIAVLSFAIFSRRTAVRLGLWFVRLLTKARLVKHPEKTSANTVRQITLFHESFVLIWQKKGELCLSFITTIVQLTLYFGLTYLVYRGFGLTGNGTFVLIMSAQAILTLVTAFVPLPGSSGVAETGFHMIFGLFFTHNVLAPAVLVWRLLTYYACLIVGGAVALLSGKRAAKAHTG